jgi:hypothetical protein
VYEEAISRGYNFDREKIWWDCNACEINVTIGQLHYEKEHLLNKLVIRDPVLYKKVKKQTLLRAHPLFNIVEGDVEEWEIGSQGKKL